MGWIRQVSLVRRVVIGFTLMAVLIAALGGTALLALQPPAAAGASSGGAGAWLVGAITVAGVGLAALCAVLIRASIKA